MQKLYQVAVKGKRHKWAFNFWSDDYEADWEEDSLMVCQVVNTVPQWITSIKLTKIWCWLQDKFIIPLE